MRVIINAASIFKGGAEQVVHSFINECRDISGNEYHIFLCDNILNLLELKQFSKNFHFYKLKKRPGISLYNLYKSLRHFDRLEKEIRPDVVISTGGHGYWKPKAPLITAFNIPHYVYPESPYFDIISLRRKIYWKFKKQFDLLFYKRSDAIITQTEDVTQRVRNLIPSVPVHTVSNTVNGFFLNPPVYENKLQPKEEGEIRLLTLSSNYPHKNLDIIPDVVESLRKAGKTNIKFILTLPGEAFEKSMRDGVKSQIINVGPVPIEECPSLYRECDMMFLPTLLECFSASYVEAMAMKKPILTSDLGFARSICKDAAIYFNPLDETEIAESIIELVQDKELQVRLVQMGLTIFSKINSPKERAEKFLSLAKSRMLE